MRDPDQHEADGEFGELFALLDHPVPRVEAIEIMSRVRRRRVRRSALLAAAALLSMATIATAAIPGTPLHEIMWSLLRTRPTAAVALRPRSLAHATVPPATAAPLGIAFVPGDRAIIEFRADQSAGELYIRLDTVSRVKILATGAGEARYSLTPSGVEIDNAGSTASYEIVVPVALTHATVRVSERVVASRERSVLVCGAMRVSTGSCVVTLQP